MFHRRPDRPPRPHRRRPAARRRAEKVRQDADKPLDPGDHGGGDERRGDYGGLLASSQSLVRLSDGQTTPQRGKTPP
ncbi:hypothetical protein [Streptomyces sp. NPDC056192]|uniref:hypothetical protein n=1 Tax=Streptomyces sp. NPDC056192 TaxID=3345743 RepID=UPI0035E196C8